MLPGACRSPGWAVTWAQTGPWRTVAGSVDCLMSIQHTKELISTRFAEETFSWDRRFMSIHHAKSYPGFLPQRIWSRYPPKSRVSCWTWGPWVQALASVPRGTKHVGHLLRNDANSAAAGKEKINNRSKRQLLLLSIVGPREKNIGRQNQNRSSIFAGSSVSHTGIKYLLES